MGYLNERFGITMVLKARKGACPECGVEHEPEFPHNKQSLLYQYTFYDKHGYCPSWRDAMAHCSEEMKKAWSEALAEKGEDLDARPKMR